MDNKTSREEPKYPNKHTLISKILDRDKEGMDKFGLTMREKMLKNPNDCKQWLNNSLEEKIDDARYTIEAILSYQNLFEENKKLKKENKELKEYNKMLLEHP